MMTFPLWVIPIIVFSTVVMISYIVNALRQASEPPTTVAWAPELPLQTAETTAGKLRYIKTGTGPTLVLLHTFRTQLDIFQKVIPALAENFTVYAVDYPGHGYSDIPKTVYTPEFLRGAMRSFLDGLAIEDALIVGESIGGTLALLLAAEHNPRVARVVALNPFDYPARRGIMRATWVANVIFTLTHVPILGPTMWRFRPPKPFRIIMQSGLHNKAAMSPALLAEMYKVGHRPHHYKAFVTFVRHFADWAHARTEYGQIQLPVCLVYGDHDWSMKEDRVSNAALIPGAEEHTVQHAGHFMSLDAPEAVVQIVEAFGRPRERMQQTMRNGASLAEATLSTPVAIVQAE